MVISYSKKEGLVDVPNERKIHTKPISRIGGVAIWASTMLTFLCLVLMSYYPYGKLMSGILLGSSLMFLLGLIDDVYGLGAKFKLLIQVSIATIVYMLGVQINTIPFLNLDLAWWLSYPITLLWIVGISNAVNFIDGVDGLAGSVVTVNALTLAILAITLSPPNPISALIGFILAGSMLAFLTFNFNPAKIFMGDSGSMFLGYIIAVIALLGFKNVTLTTLLAPICLLAIPIMDTAFAILRRIINKKPISEPDKQHLHHQLLNLNLSHRNVVLVIYVLDILFAGAMLTYMLYDRLFGVIIYAILFIVILIFVMKSNIIIDHNKK